MDPPGVIIKRRAGGGEIRQHFEPRIEIGGLPVAFVKWHGKHQRQQQISRNQRQQMVPRDAGGLIRIQRQPDQCRDQQDQDTGIEKAAGNRKGIKRQRVNSRKQHRQSRQDQQQHKERQFAQTCQH